MQAAEKNLVAKTLHCATDQTLFIRIPLLSHKETKHPFLKTNEISHTLMLQILRELLHQPFVLSTQFSQYSDKKAMDLGPGMHFTFGPVPRTHL